MNLNRKKHKMIQIIINPNARKIKFEKRKALKLDILPTQT